MMKAIIFDYDGVIVDSFPNVHKVYMTICKKLGKKCPSDFLEFKKVYGYNAKECAANLGFSESDVQECNRLYATEILKKDHKLFDGIKEVLETLKQSYKMVLISSSRRAEVMSKLQKYALDKDFDIIFASDELGPMRKLKAIKDTLDQFKLSADEVLMIGDRTIDYDEGIQSGIKKENIIIVEYGWGYDHAKIKQKILVKKPIDLLKVINVTIK